MSCESLKICMDEAPSLFAMSRPAINASYLGSLFEVRKLNLKAYKNLIPLGASRNTRTLHPLSSDDPSTYIVHWAGAFRVELPGCVGFAMKFATAWPVIDVRGSNVISYSLSFSAHFINRQKVLGLWNTCLKGRLVRNVQMGLKIRPQTSGYSYEGQAYFLDGGIRSL